MIKCTLNLKEKEFQDLMEIYIRRQCNHTRVEIFREVNVNGSVADFVVFSPFGKGFVHVYELKMAWDKDYKRIRRQIKDYSEVADRVTVATFNAFPTIELEPHVNIMKVSVVNGWLNYCYKDDGYHILDNSPNTIDIQKRLKFLQQINKVWSDKCMYTEKIIGVL